MRNAVQVSYCAQLNTALDKASTCQQQRKAQTSCRRSCGLCYDKVDSSSLVWYNQAESQRSSPALTPTPTPTHSQADPRGSFSNPARSQAQGLSGLQDARASDREAQLKPLSNSADELSRQLDDQALANDPQANDLVADDIADAISSQHVEDGPDSMVMRPASTGLDAGGMQAGLTPSSMHESELGVADGLETSESNVYTVEQLNSSSGDSKLPNAAAMSIPIKGQNDSRHLGLTNQDSWQNHLSNPFCMSVLCLCALLMTCVICLFRGKFRRKKVIR